MSESQQLIRQWKLLQMLADFHQGCALNEISVEMGVTDRTVRRDLAVLQTVGIPLEEYVGDRGRKRWRVRSLSQQFGFTVTELLSVYMGRQFMEPLAGTPFWDGQRKVLQKIRGALGEQAIRYLQKLSGSLHATSVGASDYSKRGDLIDHLMLAIEDRLITLIVYQSMQATEPVEQEVYPLGMIYLRESLYLIAWSSTRQQVRNYKVDRIDSVSVEKLRYSVPEEFVFSDWLADSFGVYRSGRQMLQTIRVHFNRDVARYVQESHWHGSQKLIPHKDGSLIAEYELPDTQEIKRWIMSFGPAATVLAPEELADEIRDDLTQMLEAYAERPN